ncbi:hypothetical protein Dsin_004842 [Dipteronia sinensis]|uniref:PB1-like domain-containing protein n=1 Tax=Dipteronia sinensis TaxID=43782 RepID=A0AAE0EFW8_9ROSI|nr:hypothetical protein Dsin_004842 [Dipteronia sinensis]
MKEPRKPDDEQPKYDPHDLNKYFSFRVHHGGEFDESLVNYVGGSESYYDYVSLDELSMLDIDDIALELGYSIPMGYWIEVLGYGKPFIIGCDLDLLWFQDRIPKNRVVDLYLQPINPLQVVSGIEYLPSPEGGTGDSIPENIVGDVPHEGVSDGLAEGVGDGPTEAFVDGPAEDRNRTSRVTEECDDVGESVERAAERRKKGKHIVEEDIADDGEENGELWESDYEQEEEDITAETYDLRSLDESDCEEEEGRKSRIFINTRYHEFDPGRDMENPIFKIADQKTFKIKSVLDEHTCAMCFRNSNSGLIPNVDASIWQYYRARTAAREPIQAFNKAILQARDKPVITLMEMIINYLMKRLIKKMAEVEKWKHDIWPNVFRVIEKLKMESSICHPEYSGNLKYQVMGPGDEHYVVNIDTKTCAYNRWQLIRIPCIYGILCLLSSNRDPIDHMYKKESFTKAYAPIIYGINGPRIWPKTNDKPVQCPQFKNRGAGQRSQETSNLMKLG